MGPLNGVHGDKASSYKKATNKIKMGPMRRQKIGSSQVYIIGIISALEG